VSTRSVADIIEDLHFGILSPGSIHPTGWFATAIALSKG